MDQPLAVLGDLVAVELAGRKSGQIAGALLAAMGARVIRIEPSPGGDPAAALAFDRRKEVIDASTADLDALLTDADILITSGGPAWAGIDAGWPGYAGVWIDLSPYGASGPCRDWRATDLTIASHAGMAVYVGEPDREPLVPPGDMASHQAALAAVVGALAALGSASGGSDRREATRLEVAEFDVMATSHLVGLYSLAFFFGDIPRRRGRRKPAPYPFTLLPCADGLVCLTFLEGRQWGRFVETMGAPPWTEEARYRDRRAMGEQYPDEVDALVVEWLTTKTRAELVELALKNGFPVTPVRSIQEVLTSEQLESRHFFESVKWKGDPVLVPGLPYGWHSGGPRAAPPDRSRSSPGSGPLAGVRVIDLGRVVSAPGAGQWLADLGADVIKVESRTHLDSARKGRPLIDAGVEASDAGLTPDSMPFFLATNRGKRSLTLDLGTEGGRDVFERLISRSDVVIENFGSGGLERLGIGPNRLHEIQPNLVIARVSAAGQTGPDARLPGYAPHSTAAAGLDSLCHYPDEPPIGMIASNFGDLNAAAYTTLAILAALRAGAGVTVDISMLEANVDHLAEELLAAQVGAAGPRSGFRGLFRCRGDDEWLAVDARSPGETEAVAKLTGAQGEDALRVWARSQDKLLAAADLQSVCVPAAPAMGVEELLYADQVRQRNLVVDVPHRLLGVVPVHGAPLVGPPGFMEVRGPAPDLGQHTIEVLHELGLSAEEIQDLSGRGAFDEIPIE